MAEYLDSVIVEYFNSAVWVDITAYVVGDIKGSNGLGGWKPDQRVAVLGTLNITLNNKAKLFSPMGGDEFRQLSTLTGFNKRAKIRITGTFRGVPKTIWTGWIMSLDSDDKNWGNEQVRLMAVDWMNVPVDYPMAGATIALNKRIDEAMTLILARLSRQPDAIYLPTGNFTFPAVFDNVQRKTMALSEFTKLANSELGYIYVMQDGTLVAENMLLRQGWRALDQITIPELWTVSPDNNFLLMEDGYFLLMEDGNKILLDEGTLDAEVTEDAAIAADAEAYNILLGEDDFINASIIRAHPVITDTSLKVLYKLGTPLFIPSGQTKDFSAHYTDPSGLSQVSGTNMQTPVATTDYLANTLADGTGTNKTANVVVTATYYGDTVYYSIANNATTGVYITFLQARGYGIYYGNSIESTVEDAISQGVHGYSPFQFDMKYQKDTYLADMYGLSVIEEYKNPKSRTTKMKYLANLNKNHMVSFLVLTIGSLIFGTEDRSGLSNHYYITDRAFTIKQGGIINVEYGVKQNDSYLSGALEPVTVEFAYNSTDAINYGNLPLLGNLSNRSYGAWIYRSSQNSPNIAAMIFGHLSDYSGVGIFLGSDNTKLNIQVKCTSQQGHWETATGLLSTGVWQHVVVTLAVSGSTISPVAYIDGTAYSLTEVVVHSGAMTNETGDPFVIGNELTATIPLNLPFNGQIFDARVYNRILSAAEVTTLYNAGVPDHTLVTDGLVFQGMARYVDQTPPSGTSTGTKLTENILRAVGVVHGSPVIRDNP